ncbi:unnamed protein product [Vitrella brassicaformis CCMP3155]|uniref:Uncharacterized protein n=1 Tax=Vitrella brassicaformis (strain CCMP3155) TaxID=1169540 RepID=A0A0G4FUA0_VITBC|nr:unnamed protein product [Vitrella brassicaformis CCMP3155]|eukprot:CEM17927.1 unnamed protein product [Vitrella brassicaformis CCMP3155]
MKILLNSIQAAVGSLLLLVFPLTVLAFRPSRSIVRPSPRHSRPLAHPPTTDVRPHVMARVSNALRRPLERLKKDISRKTGETAISVNRWISEEGDQGGTSATSVDRFISEERGQGVTSYQNLILHKDEILDTFIYKWLSENRKFVPVTIFENFAGQALFNSGFEKGWTYQRTCDYHMHQQVEALGEIVETRPLDRLVDRKLRVMFDAYNRCCKDERTFAEFYKGLVDEISKPEHNSMGSYVGPPTSICLSMPQDDFCCAMEIICGSMSWGTWRKLLTDEELMAIQQWQENLPAEIRSRQTTSAGRV